MNYQLKADKLTIKNPKASGQSHVYLAPTEAALASGLGQLFIIVEIKSKEKKVPTILNQIVQELSEYFYHSPTKNAEAALETTCQYFNENVTEISQKNWQWLKEKISIIVAAVQDDRLSLSNYNNMKAWLVRAGKIHDISGSETESKKAATPKKIMSQIISGQLEDGDVLLLSNATIFDYFAEEKIKKTITTLAPTQACAFLKNTLVDYKVSADFSTAIIRFLNQEKAQMDGSETGRLNILQNTEMDDRLRQRRGLDLAGKLKSRVAQIKIWWLAGVAKIKSNWQSKISRQPALSDNLGPDVSNGDSPKTSLRSKLGFGHGTADRPLGKWLDKLPFKEYRLIIFIVIIALLFVGSLKIVSNKRAESAEQEKLTASVKTIKDKFDSIEAALIYKDENKAQQLLAEANQLLGQFAYKETIGKTDYTELSAQAETMTAKVYKLERINKDGYLAKLPAELTPNSNLAVMGESLYFASANNIYKISAKDGALNQTATSEDKIKKIINFDDKQLALYGSGGQIFLLAANQATAQKKSFNQPEGDQAVDVALYNKKLYLLGEKNIYSYAYNNNNYGAPTAWLKQETSVAGNETIAVDGNVWLAAADGQISRLFMGKKEAFALSGLYEPISASVKIYTTEQLKNLYLLDQEKNRITIANKQGKVLRQILGDNLDKVVSVTPASDEKQLYILTTSGVYKLGL